MNVGRSKRPSAAKLPKPPETVSFFLDRSLGKRIFAGALRQAGVSVEVHDDYFRPDATDKEMAGGRRREGMGRGYQRSANSLQGHRAKALRSSGVRAFAFTRGNFSGEEMAAIFLKALPKIQKFLRKHKQPFIATMTREGNVRMMV